MQTPQEHFTQLEAIFQKHADALEADVRALQKAHNTSQWPTAWKKLYNWNFAQCFANQGIFRNWAADCAAWHLLPKRVYPNRGNCQGEVREEKQGEF